MHVYQETANQFVEHPELQSALDTYTSIAHYYCDVLLAFMEEVKRQWRRNSKKWCSTFIDYHLTMTINNCAFIEPMQKQTLAKIQCTWDDFKYKKPYEPIQERGSISNASVIHVF